MASINKFLPSQTTFTKFKEGDHLNKNTSSSNIQTNVDLSPYIHSSIFEVLQPSKNLKVKICSFKNLETIEDDVYQKLYQIDQPNKPRYLSVPQGQPQNNNNYSSSKKIQDNFSQTNRNQLFSNQMNSPSKIQFKENLIQNTRSSEDLAMKRRNSSEFHSSQNLGAQSSSILKQKYSQNQRLQAPLEDQVLIQLNLFAKKNQSSTTPRNLQFLAVKKDQFQKTLNYLEQLNQVNEESQGKSQSSLSKDLQNKLISKANDNCQQKEEAQNQIKSFANIAEIQTKLDISSKNNLQQDNQITNTSSSSANNQNINNGYMHQDNQYKNNFNNNPPSLIISNPPFNHTSLTPIFTQQSHQRIQSITALNNNSQLQSYTKLNSHFRTPSYTNLDNSNQKLANFKSTSKKQLTRPSQSQANSQSITKLKYQQTLQVEEINHQQINPSTLDQIDQLNQSIDKLDKQKDNTDPVPQANPSQNQQNIKKQATISYKNEGSRKKNISFLNLQEVNNYNKEPLSSRNTADSTPFEKKQAHNIETHLSQFRMRHQQASPASTNIHSKQGQESEDRKSTQNDSQFHSTIQKKQQQSDNKTLPYTHNQRESIRQISPFLINQANFKGIQVTKDSEELYQSNAKNRHSNYYRFESPLQNPTGSFLDSDIKDSKFSHSAHNSLTQNDFNSSEKKLNKLQSKDFGSSRKRLNVSILKGDSQNEQGISLINQQMNMSQLSSGARFSTTNMLQKDYDQMSPLKLNPNLKTIFTTDNSDSDNTSPQKKKLIKKIDEKKQEPVSQFIQKLYSQKFNDNIEVPQSIQQLNNGEIFQSSRFQVLEKNQNEIFDKFISQPPFIQGKVKCGLYDYIKQQKNTEMNRLKTYYKFGFSATNKDEKSIKLQNVLEGIVPSNEVGGIHCNDLWSEKHVKIIHDRVNFAQEKQFIQSYLAYKSRNPAKNFVFQKKKPTLDLQKVFQQSQNKIRTPQGNVESKCLTDRFREQKQLDTLNNTADNKTLQKSQFNPSQTSLPKRLTTKSSSMTQCNFKTILPNKMNIITNKPEEFTREKILFKDFIQFTDRVLSNNAKDIKVYSEIKKYEDEEQE